ncbi:hypothetical protein KCP75_15510 [Salmonella enterica subsp. enterica]|nr:hypothetical protein KCP75_15510 [Salmonella enterica subsp. enterica]
MIVVSDKAVTPPSGEYQPIFFASRATLTISSSSPETQAQPSSWTPLRLLLNKLAKVLYPVRR